MIVDHDSDAPAKSRDLAAEVTDTSKSPVSIYRVEEGDGALPVCACAVGVLGED